MPTTDQALSCVQGDTFNFAITLQANPDNTAPDLSGATAQWKLFDGNYQEAETLLAKVTPDVIVNQDDQNNWQVVVGLNPVDTQNIAPGIYYHQAKVILSGGGVSHIEGGPFNLAFGS